MSSKKGQKKFFDSGVIIAILIKRGHTRTDSGRQVNMGDVAEINEHLFPSRGRCMGLLVGVLAINLSRPEILRQCDKLKGINIKNATPSQLKKVLGKKVSLICIE